MFLFCAFLFFFFNDTATTEIYTLSLHDALPISKRELDWQLQYPSWRQGFAQGDRKSTRLNSSHDTISYAVFCLKKKKNGRAVMLRRKKKKNTRVTRRYTTSN